MPTLVAIRPGCARKTGPQAKLAALLRMFTLAFPRSTAVGLQAAKDLVLLQPVLLPRPRRDVRLRRSFDPAHGHD